MVKRSKVFLPKWVQWFITPLFLVVWAIVTYQTFWTPGGRKDLGVIGWLGITLIWAIVWVVVWLMSSRKLPAYIIEDDQGNEH